MVSLAHGAVVFATLVLVLAKFLERRSVGDGTAQGVAKVRHIEAMQEESVRLYSDPYAKRMYPGSFVLGWLGASRSKRLFDAVCPGILELLTLRTKWIDDQIAIHIHGNVNGNDKDPSSPACGQMVILGAGYDTRGFRLDVFPEGFKIIEVDQPPVQASKQRALKGIASYDDRVASCLKNNIVSFVEVDFNNNNNIRNDKNDTDNNNNDDSSMDAAVSGVDDSPSVGEKLRSSSSFNSHQKSIVLLEGVTQYIPKSSTASTLKQLHEILPAGSILLISYVPQNILNVDVDDPGRQQQQQQQIGSATASTIRFVLKMVAWYGEPWISAWTPPQFASFLSSDRCGGYEVLSDTTVMELKEKYLIPLMSKNRRINKKHELALERYVVAEVVKNM